MIDKLGSNFKDYAPLMSRLALGVISIVSGARVLAHRPSGELEDSIATLGLFPGEMWGFLACLAGLLVLIGFGTRWAAAFLSVIFIMAIYLDHGFSAFTRSREQLPFACLALALAVYCSGAGDVSVDKKLQKKGDK